MRYDLIPITHIGHTWLLKGDPPCERHKTAGKGRPPCINCDNRTLTQRVAEACTFSEWHELQVHRRRQRACTGCGLYLVPVSCPCWCHDTSMQIFRGEKGWQHHVGKCWCNGGSEIDV